MDLRERLKQRVVGLGEGTSAVALVRSAVAAAGVIEVQVDGRDLVWHRPGQASAPRPRGDRGEVELVEANMKGRELVRADPLPNRLRVTDDAAKEHNDEIMPNPLPANTYHAA